MQCTFAWLGWRHVHPFALIYSTLQMPPYVTLKLHNSHTVQSTKRGWRWQISWEIIVDHCASSALIIRSLASISDRVIFCLSRRTNFFLHFKCACVCINKHLYLELCTKLDRMKPCTLHLLAVRCNRTFENAKWRRSNKGGIKSHVYSMNTLYEHNISQIMKLAFKLTVQVFHLLPNILQNSKSFALWCSQTFYERMHLTFFAHMLRTDLSIRSVDLVEKHLRFVRAFHRWSKLNPTSSLDRFHNEFHFLA